MLLERMIRAARLDNSLYEEVERDTTATTQALYVVIIVSLASGIGGAISAILAGAPGSAVGNLVGGIIWAVLGWIIWSLVTYWIGTSLMGGTATPGELLRTIGFANTPNILAVFGFVFCVGPLVALAGAIWALVAGVIAVRAALDFDTGKAIITVIIGWVAMMLFALLLSVFGLGFNFLSF